MYCLESRATMTATKAEIEDMVQVGEALFNIKWTETDIIKFYIKLLELKIDPEALEMFMDKVQKVKGEKVGINA